MTLYEQMDSEIPDYYDGMHRDGYNADQILHALRRKMKRIHWERKAAEESPVYNVKIISEVKIK
jgi:hypothetical protein